MDGEEAELARREPRVQVGFYVGHTFEVLNDGDRLPVLAGSQGGSWVMPGVRVRGLQPEMAVEGTLRTNDEQLGITRTTTTLAVDNHWFHLATLPIPVQHERPSRAIDGLTGSAAWLDVRVDDVLEATQLTLEVVLLDQRNGNGG